MTEEPIREEEGSEELSLAEKIQNETKNVRERLTRGGTFLLAVFFVVGIIFGISAKTLAGKSITIGYWDYTVSPRESGAIDLNAAQTRILAKTAEETAKQKATEQNAADEKNADTENPESPSTTPSPEPAK